MLVDTHCHLTSPELARRVEAVMRRAAQAGVQRAVVVAVSPADARAALDLLTGHPELFLAAGIHPHEAGRCTAADRAALAALHRGEWPELGQPGRLVAVGETGLDFHHDPAPPRAQEELFRFQLELAGTVGRPLIVHARDSEQRVCQILAEYPRLAGRVVFHCYSGDEHTAQSLLEAGCWLSFSGIVTFKNARAVRAAARLARLDRILLETDAPHLAPEPVRRLRPCEPALLVHTARRLAEVRGLSLAQLAAATTANAQRFFNLPESSP